MRSPDHLPLDSVKNGHEHTLAQARISRDLFPAVETARTSDSNPCQANLEIRSPSRRPCPRKCQCPVVFCLSLTTNQSQCTNIAYLYLYLYLYPQSGRRYRHLRWWSRERRAHSESLRQSCRRPRTTFNKSVRPFHCPFQSITHWRQQSHF